jgi:8-oxo-dGTP pyrophosphatase MutT (NUDIX family)
MAKVIYGDRIGRTAELRTGCSAFILDPMGERVLLTRRTDNGRWCLPGGAMEAGESLAETCVREVWEETGLEVRILKLVGVYSSPNRIVTYPDGNQWQIISHNFEAEVIGGELTLSNETTEFGYFTPVEIAAMDVMEHHREIIADGLSRQATAYIR